jgi:hypothetical protein
MFGNKKNEDNKETSTTKPVDSKGKTPQANTKEKPKENKADKIAQLFKNNPLRKELFQTSDGYFFIDKSLAKKHAATLKSKKVEVIAKTQNKPSVDESED